MSMCLCLHVSFLCPVFVNISGETKITVVLRYRRWSISLDRDGDEYNILELVNNAYAFLNKPLAMKKTQFVSLSSHPPNKPSLK